MLNRFFEDIIDMVIEIGIFPLCLSKTNCFSFFSLKALFGHQDNRGGKVESQSPTYRLTFFVNGVTIEEQSPTYRLTFFVNIMTMSSNLWNKPFFQPLGKTLLPRNWLLRLRNHHLLSPSS